MKDHTMLEKLKKILSAMMPSESSVTINGVTHRGKCVNVTSNGDVSVDGLVVSRNNVRINITIDGNVGKLDLVAGTVTVNGNADSVSTVSGNAHVSGDASTVVTTSGNVDVGGNVDSVDTNVGDVTAKAITQAQSIHGKIKVK